MDTSLKNKDAKAMPLVPPIPETSSVSDAEPDEDRVVGEVTQSKTVSDEEPAKVKKASKSAKKDLEESEIVVGEDENSEVEDSKDKEGQPDKKSNKKSSGKKKMGLHMPDWVKFGFPPPEYLRFNFAGINLSDHSIKVCKSVINHERYVIDVIDSISLPEGAIVSGAIKDSDAVIKVLKKIKDTYKIDFVRLSVPEELVYLASFTIPPTPHNKLRSVVEFHIGDHIPLSVDEIEFDFDVVMVTDSNKVTEVVASAIAKTTVLELTDLLKGAELNPLSLEVEAQAIARVVIPPESADKTFLILDLGRSRSGISITSGGVVHYTTTISFGGDTLVDQIAELRGVEKTKAEEIKQSVGLDLEQYSADERAEIEKVIDLIVSQIKRRENFWLNQTGKKINEVLLVGGNASTPHLTTYLQSKTGLVVRVPNVWQNVYPPGVTNFPVSDNESLGYAAVIGLAINENK